MVSTRTIGGARQFFAGALLATISAALVAPPPVGAVDYVRIKNLATGKYLYDADNRVWYGTPTPTDATSQWFVEDFAGSKRIRNRATGNYMSIQNTLGYVESIPVYDGWLSPRWTFETAATPGYIVIRSAWLSANIIHVENQLGYAQYGSNVPTTASSAQWLLEPAPPIQYVRIKNVWNGSYLYEQDNRVQYGSPLVTDSTSHWLVEDFAGSKRIRNRVTGNYMNIEHQLAWVESTPVYDVWMSARWTFESGAAAGSTIIRSAWQTTKVVNIQTLQGYAECTAVPTSFTSAMWMIENVNPAESYVRLKNRVTGAYLYESGNMVFAGSRPPNDVSSHWLLEDYAGSKRFRNRASGKYMAIQNQYPWVESIPISDAWMSARWTLENAPTPGYTNIRSVWQTTKIIYGGSSYAQYGNVPTSYPPAMWLIEDAPRGATVPWTEYEAEEGVTNGTILGPSRAFGNFAAESSKRRAVQLDNLGQYVQVTTTQPANSIVVRYIIPDSASGTGMDATISLYVNGVFQGKLNLTSKHAWLYGGAENSSSNNPSDGGEHHFYDETRALLASIPAGATVRLQKDVGDLAAFYVIDLIDLEQVPPPLAMPANFLSIVTDCGAIPNDGLNDEPAIRTCIANAKAQGTGVWIPAGTFENTTQAFSVSDVTIRGAGMWYSTIHGPHASFHCAGNNCRFYDFSVFGESVTRQIVLDEFGFLGKAGTGSRLENIWVEHTQVGYWVGSNDSTKPVTDGLVITGARIRNTFADGVNFCNGTSNSEVVNSHFRNTGDDAVASWSPRSDSTNVGNMIHFNTVQIPWRANCYAIYGGRDNKIEDNLCYDVVTYPGIMVAQDFESNAFAGVTSVQRNTLIRAGGPMWGVEQGALKVWAPDASVLGLVVNEIDMDGSTFSGIQFEGPQNVIDATFSNVTIANAGTWGIHLRPDAHGDATFTNVAVSNPASGGLLNEGSNFVITRGTGNSGW